MGGPSVSWRIVRESFWGSSRLFVMECDSDYIWPCSGSGWAGQEGSPGYVRRGLFRLGVRAWRSKTKGRGVKLKETHGLALEQMCV